MQRERKMNNLQKMWQQLLAIVLCLGMIFGAVDTTVFAADDVITSPGITADDKAADPSTMSGWQDYFREDSTEYAGAVWSDKSVFESTKDFQTALEAEDDSYDASSIAMENDEDNFLVALSALASNKEIVGYSTIPTDTILVLDVSQSMDNSSSVPDMISATNSAIKKLLNLNLNNRIGVVLYSGNHNFGTSNTSTGVVLLPLGRYTANSSGQYISYSSYNYDRDENNGTMVSVANGVKDAATNTTVTVTSKVTQGGTYIQNGLYKAYEMFNAVTDTTVTTDGDNVQEGTKRMPILVLMSDGAPTTGTTSYNNVGTSNAGNGGRSSDGLGFMTQLTAAWVRGKVEAKYDNQMKFYTLGLELSREDQSKQDVAKSVLNPSSSTTAINNIWADFIPDGKASFSVPNTTGNNSNNGDKTVTVTNANDGVTFTASSQNYVDRFFEADSNSELNSAFDDIVEEIMVQSAYYPTLVSSGEHDLDGYVSFEDQVGMFMEVKNITGLLLGDTLYSGKTLVYMMAETEVFGDRYTYTELGWELVHTVSERIGVTDAQAISMLQTAWQDKQLYYEDDNNYSNYIGWYETADGQYVGNWMQAHTENDAAAMVSAGAKYITKSYGFYGPADENSSIAGSNMMHVIVKVRTDIETGNQTVIFEVPASLIPMVTYSVQLDTDSLETAKDIDITMSADEPIRLVYEAGLRSDINELTVNQIYDELQEELLTNPDLDLHMHKNSDGTYSFYTNTWASGSNIEDLDPSQHEATEAWFEPSVENERYYYTANSTIYVKSGDSYQVYTGAQPTAGDAAEYYYPRTYFTGTENAQKVTIYVPIADATLAYVQAGENNSWYVPKGQIYRELIRFIQRGTKSINATDTLIYYTYPVLYQPNAEDSGYDIYKYHGNNGKLTLKPATGIKLTKEIDDTITATDTTYTFTITVNGDRGSYNLYRQDPETGEYVYHAFTYTDGTITVTLEAGQTIYLTGLPVGDYTITETESADYTVKSVTVDGVLEEDKTAADKIEEYVLDAVVFTNTENKEGDLIVRKTITHNLPTTPESFATKQFTAEIVLKDASGAALANKTYSDGAGNSVTTDANGKAVVTLVHNGSVTLKGLPEGATYTVTETNIPTGFTLKTTEANLSGTIAANDTAIVTLVNDYQPGGVPANGSVKVSMTKAVEGGRGWQDGDSFTFHVEKMNDNGTWTQIGASQTIDYATKDKALVFDVGQLTTVGTHTYRIVEENANSIPGITSDSARYFTVTVTDTDGDGYLEISNVEGSNVTYSDADHKVSMEFTNTYATEGEVTVNIPVHKLMNNTTGVNISLAGYTFEMTGKTTVAPVTTNAAGEAEFHLEFTGDQFDEWNKAEKDADPEKDNPNTVVLDYVITETTGSATGIGYSSESYQVQIVLEKADAVLSEKSVTITKNEEEVSLNNVSFTNTFTLTGNTSVDFPVEPTKGLTGRSTPVKEGEFSFNLYETGADFIVTGNAQKTVSNDAAGKVNFGKITYTHIGTYYYVIEEANAGKTIDGVTHSTEKYYVTVVIGTDDNINLVVKSTTIVKPGSGEITSSDVTFTNTYKPEAAEIVLGGTKTLATDKVFKNLEHGMFTFELLDEEGNVIDTAVNLTTSLNSNTAAFTFNKIEYDTTGVHTYTIREDIPDDKIAGVSYDSSEYTVVVTVSDDDEGSLKADAVITKNGTTVDEAAFTNTYTAAPASIVLKGTKELKGRTLTAGEFKFQLYTADADFNEGSLVDTVSNAADGSVQFDLGSVDRVDTYYYIIKEDLSAQEKNVHYDEKEYHVTVEVYDIGGQLSSLVTYEVNGSSASGAAFVNIYSEPLPAEFTLEAKKNLSGRTLKADDFTFELYETDDSYTTEGKTAIQTKKNSEDGNVLFDTISLDETKTYYYVVKELVPSDTEGVTYDKTEYQIKVVVADEGDGYLRETVYVNGVDKTSDHQTGTLENVITFSNSYHSAEGKVTFGGKKTLDGKKLTASEFEFGLYETGSDFAVAEDAEPIYSVWNDADGTFTFDTLTYTADTTKYYVIKEIAGSDEKVDYDDTVYNIKVAAADDGKGQVLVDVYYGNIVLTQAEDITITNFDFNNGYDPDDAVVNLSGNKVLEGRSLEDKEFTFVLYETGKNFKVGKNAEPIQTKANIDGSFAFDSLVYETLETDKEETHYYVVKELSSEESDGIIYDETEYQITVTVKNNGSGALSIDVKYADTTLTDVEVAAIENLNFKNTYVVPVTVNFDVTKLVENKSEEKMSPEGFQFKLTTGLFGETVATATSDAAGKAAFTMTYTIDDIGKTYTYKISEVNTKISGMQYDNNKVTVEVTITEENGVLTATVKQDGNTVNAINAKFVNTYYGEGKVVTGDFNNPVLWAFITADAFALGAITLVYRKRKTSK